MQWPYAVRGLLQHVDGRLRVGLHWALEHEEAGEAQVRFYLVAGQRLQLAETGASGTEVCLYVCMSVSMLWCACACRWRT